MNADALSDAMRRLVADCGIEGCALVDVDAGLVWASSGCTPDAEGTWEASVNYWRLHQRQHQHFDAAFGPLVAAMMFHKSAVLTVVPCCDDPPLVLAAWARHRHADWVACQQRAHDIGRMVRQRDPVARPSTTEPQPS